jgi:hypothetical protein
MTIQIKFSQATRSGYGIQSVDTFTSLCFVLGTGAVGFNILQNAKYKTRTANGSSKRQCIS